MTTPVPDGTLPLDETYDMTNVAPQRAMGNPWAAAGFDEANHFVDSPGFDKPAELFMLMADVARLSKSIDIVTELADEKSHGTMPDSAYLDLARNVGPFRSWGNYIRSMDEHGLGGTDHSPENIGILRRTLDSWQLPQLGDGYGQQLGEPSFQNSAALLSAAQYLSITGKWLSKFVNALPPSHRAADLNLPDHDLFKKDLIARPVRAIQSTCAKTLSALAAWDELPVNIIAKRWGLWRDQEQKLRRWGYGIMEGDAPLDSYLEVGGRDTEKDAEFLFDALSRILYQLCDVLKVQLPSSPASEESKPIKDCRFYLLRIDYILNQDFMFFPATERWADRMITELSSSTPMGEFLNFVVDPKEGIDRATHTLFQLTRTMAFRALDMKDDLLRWPNGHLWEASRKQVNRIGEGAERILRRESIVSKVLAAQSPVGRGSAVQPPPESTFEPVQIH